MIGSSNLNITNTTFENNQALQRGGAIYATAFGKIKLFEGN
jgi:predicted outer membrane repeat protein